MWTDAVVEELKKHYKGGLTASQAAGMLNARYGTEFTRNAVISKLHRDGIAIVRDTPSRKRGQRQTNSSPGSILKPTRDASCTRGGRMRRPNKTEKTAPSLPATPTEALHPAPAEGLTFMELGLRHCRWPVAERDGEHIFCGATRQEGGPYCCAHMASAYVTPMRTKNFKYRQSGATIEADE